MEGICGLFNSDLAANWVGAAGSAGAAIVAVTVYLYDRHSANNSNAERKEASRLAQATHLAVLIDAMQDGLIALRGFATRNSAATQTVSSLRLPHPARLFEVVTDTSVFDPRDIAKLAALVTLCARVNHEITRGSIGFGDDAYVPQSAIPLDDLDGALMLSDTLSTVMWGRTWSQKFQ